MYLTALATATPDRRYTKGECWSAFVASDWFLRLDARSRSLAQLVLNRDNGMESRFLAIDSLEEVFAIEADTLQRRFATHAARLAIEAARVALARADLEPQGIDAVVVTTCTGYLCPGLTSYVIERLGLSPHIRAFDLVGQGCAGALPNWQLTAGLHRYGRAIGRDRLDTWLLERAREVGVRVIQRARVRGNRGLSGEFLCDYRRRSDGGQQYRTADETISASIVIDAHGSWERGPTDHEAKQRDQRRMPPRPSDLLAFKASFQGAALPPGLLPVLSLPGGYGGMVVADCGRTIIACCVRRDVLREWRLTAPAESAGSTAEAYLRCACRGVGAVLSSARREGAWQSVGPLRLGFNDRISPGVLAVGNVAVEAHPLVGEGICMALQSAAIRADLLGMKPRRIDKFPTHQIQERYSRACRVAFARRMHLAQLYAHIAMYRSLAAPVATLMQFWPRMLTRAARLAGKARAGALRVGRQQEIA